MFSSDCVDLVKLPDSYGAPLADYYFLPNESLLYVKWHGYLTSAAIIKGTQEALELRGKYPYYKVLHNKHDTAGDWSEALPWLQYEWLPQALSTGLRAVACILSPDLEVNLAGQKYVVAMQMHCSSAAFTTQTQARIWLLTQ